MPAHALYEATRGVWRLSERRMRARIAMPVYQGIVKEVFTIDQWHEAGSTAYETRRREDVSVSGRWEFTGRLAEEGIRERYIGKSVAAYIHQGDLN
jgi:hypothetical protein